MPMSVNPTAYPVEFVLISNKVIEKGSHIINGEYGELHKIRTKFYGFKRAVQENPEGFEEIAAFVIAFELSLASENTETNTKAALTFRRESDIVPLLQESLK